MTKALAIAAVLASSATSALATGVSAVSIAKLVDQADVILVGGVAQSVQSGTDMSLTLAPMRLLKGTVSAPSELAATWRPLVSTRRPLVAPVCANGLWFLKADAAGDLQVLPVARGLPRPEDLFIPLPTGDLPAQYQYSPDAPSIDKVAGELMAAADSPDPEDAARVHYAILLLMAPSPATEPSALQHVVALGPAHESACPIVRLEQTWDVSAVNRVTAFVANHPPDTLPFGTVASLYFIRSPAAVPGLGALLASGLGGKSVQRSAARALRNIHTQETLPYLYQLLDSPDWRVQYDAVSGFALFANNYPIGSDTFGLRAGGARSAQTSANYPAKSDFEADSASYVAFWKAWYPNRLPAVSVGGGGATCHPLGPNSPCSLPVTAAASDGNGDPLYYVWSGCASSARDTASCKVAQIGPVTATVTVDDGRGGTAKASTSLTGVNKTPKFLSTEWSQKEPVPNNTSVTATFSVSDDDPNPVTCSVGQVAGACTKQAVSCRGREIDVTVKTWSGGAGLCYLKNVSWKDIWGAYAQTTAAFSVGH